jgi:hypothetical protein
MLMFSAHHKGNTMKKPQIAKVDKAPKAPKEPKKRATSNAVDPEKRAVFLSDLEQYNKAVEKQKKAADGVAKAKAQIKDDGFTLRQIKVAIQLNTPEGEAEYKMQVANDLLAAQYAGAAIGSQLSMFLEPDRTPAVDRAFDEGTAASMKGESAKPPYDPSTPQHAKWLEGFHADTERRVKAGITKPAASAEMN